MDETVTLDEMIRSRSNKLLKREIEDAVGHIKKLSNEASGSPEIKWTDGDAVKTFGIWEIAEKMKESLFESLSEKRGNEAVREFLNESERFRQRLLDLEGSQA